VVDVDVHHAILLLEKLKNAKDAARNEEKTGGLTISRSCVPFAEAWVRQARSVGGNRDEKLDWDADHLMHQFLIVIQKHHIRNISRRENAMVARDSYILETSRRRQKIFMKLRYDLRSDPIKVKDGTLVNWLFLEISVVNH
jgi:hypothetical protein